MIRNQHTPQFINLPYSVTINENFGTTQSIYTVTATDADSLNTFERVRYQLTGDGNAPAFFSVNEVTGQIFITQSLADISQVTYNLRITAFDNGIPSRSNSTIVVVTVDRNQNSPVFQPRQYTANVADNGNLGAEVVQVTATDADTVAPYNTVRYILKSSAGSEYFFINEETGMIFVARSLALDAQSSPSYNLVVGAFDLGTPSRSSALDANVFITVTRNQFSPVFSNAPYFQSIEQTLSVGSSVLRVTATDADTVSPFGDVTMQLIGDDSGMTYFRFDPSSGVISVNTQLTSDTASSYQLRIEARDGGSPARSTTALVQISVRRNLFDPEFNTLFYNVTIDETQPLLDAILTIDAKDNDISAPHNVITYTMNDFNSLASQYFLVNSATGAVTLRQSLLNDNLDTRKYTFTVSIADNGIPVRTSNNVANVEVNVNRNTQPPFFVETPYDREMDYTESTGTVIFTATARDFDVAPYNVITYDIIGDGEASATFTIEPSTGVVRLQRNVIQETTTVYRVHLFLFMETNRFFVCKFYWGMIVYIYT